MSTQQIEVLEKPSYSIPPISYSVNEAVLAKMEKLFLTLAVASAEDREGYDKCRRARSEVRAIRIAVEDERKLQKAAALEHGRAVDAAAKVYSERCEKIEAYLKAQEKIVDDEKVRQEQEAIRKGVERINFRVAALQKVRAQYEHSRIVQMDDADFSAFLTTATDEFNAAEKLRHEEQAKLKLLEEERATQAAKIKELEAERTRLQAETIAKQRAENEAKERELDAERQARRAEQAKAENDRLERERVEAERLAAEKRKAEDEAIAKAKAEAEAARRVRDNKLFEEIKANFPTLESAWVEIARLRKEVANYKFAAGAKK